MAWVPLSSAPGRLDDAVVKATSEGTELDRDMVLAVADKILSFTDGMAEIPEFEAAPAKVSSRYLGGLDGSREVASVHAAAHQMVKQVLGGLKLDLEHFAVELRKAVNATVEVDELSEAELNRIGQIRMTHNADSRGGFNPDAVPVVLPPKEDA